MMYLHSIFPFPNTTLSIFRSRLRDNLENFLFDTPRVSYCRALTMYSGSFSTLLLSAGIGVP